MPIMLVMGWLFIRNVTDSQPVVLWESLSGILLDMMAFLGPLAAGAAAWMGSRDSQRNMEDMLSIAPLPRLSQLAATLIGTVGWGFAALLGIVVAILAVGFAKADWGSLYVWPVVSAVLGVTAYSAAGFAIGRYFPSRLTPPLVAMGVFLLQVVPSVAGNWVPASLLNAIGVEPEAIQYVVPIAGGYRDVFYGLIPDFGVAHALMFGGLTGTALAAVALRERKSATTIGVLLLSLAMPVAGLAVALDRADEAVLVFQAGQTTRAREWDVAPIPYEPVCESGQVAVCVHPAYRQKLDSPLVDGVNRLMDPLIGIDGAPVRAEQRPNPSLGETKEDTVFFELYPILDQFFGFWNYDEPRDAGSFSVGTLDSSSDFWWWGFAMMTVGEDYYRRSKDELLTARSVVAVWLVQQAGIPVEVTTHNGGFATFSTDAVRKAAQEFGALDGESRRIWLAENFAKLRSGEIGVADLPVSVAHGEAGGLTGGGK